jgi:CDP-diacylglycerol--glycerol-3-phosphate 3-phosphatidyltransferase
LNLPTALTVSRILLCPFFLAVYLYPQQLGVKNILQPIALIVLTVFIVATDALDGYLARKWRIVTKIGKLLDPMSDCIVFLSIFFCFTRAPIEIPLWIPIIMMCREIAVAYLRSLIALEQQAMGARWTGKAKTIVQFFALGSTLVGLLFFSLKLIDLKTLQQISLWVFCFTASISLFSLIEYGVHCKEVIKKSFQSSAREES